MKTIVFNLFNGFNVRYLIETGIIDRLKKKIKLYLPHIPLMELKII